MNICFFGVGGVGGYFGGLIARAQGDAHDTYFIARGGHKDAICANGLTVKKGGSGEVIKVFPKVCSDRVADLPVCDVVVVSVKGYDLAEAAREIAHIADERTVVLPLLNGVDIYERIRAQLGAGIVLPSCVYVGAHIESPGVIFQQGGACKIIMGKDPKFPDFYPEGLLTLLRASGIEFQWEEDVKPAIWSKFMFIAAYGLMGAAYGKGLGEVLDDPGLSRMTKALMGEIEEIARGLKIPLGPDAVEASFTKGLQFPHDTKTSLQRDVESKGRINEGDLFGGTLLRYGESLHIPTPVTRQVYGRLQGSYSR